jgi:hypothetical protein
MVTDFLIKHQVTNVMAMLVLQKLLVLLLQYFLNSVLVLLLQ